MADQETCEDKRDTMINPAVEVYMVGNGYIVFRQFHDVPVEVQEDPEGEAGSELAAAKMLYSVLDGIGMMGSKHDPYRVRIGVIDSRTGKDILGHLPSPDELDKDF